MERWLVTGASGQLGGHLLRALGRDDACDSVLAVTRGREISSSVEVGEIDLADHELLRIATLRFRPTHVLHIGAMTAVGDCFAQPDLARRINTDATRVLAEAAAECGARFVFSSTDMVFDGEHAPYREDDEPRPLSVYGRTKRNAELVIAALPRTLTVRIPLMYGFAATSRATTFANQIAALRRGESLKLFTDEFRTPISLREAAAALIALARSDETGVMHVAGAERLSRFDLVKRFADALNIENPRLEAVSRLSIQSPEPRPADLSLDGSRFRRRFPDVQPRPVSITESE